MKKFQDALRESDVINKIHNNPQLIQIVFIQSFTK